MKRGDIYLVNLDPTVGSEQKGQRPVLLVSPEQFNKATGTPVVLPITTTGSLSRSMGFAVNLMGCGTRTTGVIRCDQPRALDLKARKGKKLETVPAQIMGEVLARLELLFSVDE